MPKASSFIPMPRIRVTNSLDCEGPHAFFLAHADRDKNSKFKGDVAVDKYYDMAFRAPW
jgi:hypothetical protein